MSFRAVTCHMAMAEIKCLSVISINGRRLSFRLYTKERKCLLSQKGEFKSLAINRKKRTTVAVYYAWCCRVRERERNIPGNDSTLYAE
jgi:hypothetical protein